MAFQPVPDCAIVDVICNMGGKNVELTFHAQKAGGYTAVDIFNLAALMDVWAANWMLPQMSQSVTYLRCEVRGLAEQNDMFDLSAAGGGPGLIAGDIEPNQVAFSVKRSSAFTGRSARGRVYWFGLVAVEVSILNFLSIARADGIVAALNAVIPSMSAQSWTHVIVSRFTNNAPRPSGIAFAVEAYSWVDLRVDTRRDRLPAA